MTAVIDGPGWSARGLVQRSGRYPLAVEGPVLGAVDRLVPGIPARTAGMRYPYVRYFALYAALAAYSARHGLDAEAGRRLLVRSEIVLAAVSLLLDDPVAAHGAEHVRPFLEDELNVAGAAEAAGYVPAWNSYGGPGRALGTVAIEGGALRPGRHACPAPVRDLFAPLFAAASDDRLSWSRIEELEPLALLAGDPPEVPWLRELFTATRKGGHDPEAWEVADLRRRAALRMFGRATTLYGRETRLPPEDLVRFTVAFGNQVVSDPVLRGIEETLTWRGALLRNYSVGAWRRLWAALVQTVGPGGRGHQELRDWLAGLMPEGKSVQGFLDGLPATMANGQPAPAEERVLAGDPFDPMANVRLLLLGGRRAGELDGDARAAFLGSGRDILNPAWVAGRTRDFIDRPMRDFAARLVDDMLAQSRRVALSTMTVDAPGRLKVVAGLHERGGRYYRTGDGGDVEPGTRIEQLAGIAAQLGLTEVTGDGGASLTTLGSTLLEMGA